MNIVPKYWSNFYTKMSHLAGKDADDRDNLVHPTRALKFLVGLKGKSETMAIGGPWSPSLDGADPANDPSVLIKTAIREASSLFALQELRNLFCKEKPRNCYYNVVLYFPDQYCGSGSKLDPQSGLCGSGAVFRIRIWITKGKIK